MANHCHNYFRETWLHAMRAHSTETALRFNNFCQIQQSYFKVHFTLLKKTFLSKKSTTLEDQFLFLGSHIICETRKQNKKAKKNMINPYSR